VSFTLVFSKTALKDIDKHKKSGNKSILKKLSQLFNELMSHPHDGTGKPEMLKGNLAGFHSRRINKEHRLVYRIDEAGNTVHIVSLYYHYGDK